MLAIHNLYKQFGSLVAINDVNLTVNKGKTVVLMGPSGYDKSTNQIVLMDKGRIVEVGAPSEVLLIRPQILGKNIKN